MFSGLELCLLLPWVPSSSSLTSLRLWSSNAHLPAPPHHLGSGHTGSGGTLRRTGGSTSAACGLNRPLCVPWQVPWLKQGRSPLPPHARSQPGLCNMYKVRRASHQLLPCHATGRVPIAVCQCKCCGRCLGHALVQGAQQGSHRVCKAPGESQQRTRYEDREESCGQGRSRPDPLCPAWIRALRRRAGQRASPGMSRLRALPPGPRADAALAWRGDL